MGTGLSGSYPFIYPVQPHTRKHGPMGYPKHGLYRNWLRDEFTFTCVYCLRRETWATLKHDWEIDHFVPKCIHPDGALDYDNLVYACNTCNRSKAVHLAPDPCKVSYGGCVAVNDKGEIHPLENSDDGVTLIETLGLDAEDYNELRQLLLGLHDDLTAGTESHRRLFGYPKNLPDLSKESTPPGGNKRPNGIADSCYERSKRRQLPKFY